VSVLSPENGPRVRRQCLLSAILFGALPAAAFAQGVVPPPPAPSQVTPQSLAPVQIAPTPTLTITGTGATPPPGAENIRVTIADTALEGGYPEMAAATARLMAPYRNRSNTVAALYSLANAIEAAYARAGYVLVRIVVPPQSLNDGGTLQLKLVDGFVESVDVGKVPAAVAGPVADRLQRLVGVRRIRLAQIERALTLAGSLPGTTLRSTIAPGEQEGGAKLIIEADHRPVSGSVSADNRLGPVFDDWQLSIQVAANSPFGFGEQFYAYLSGAPNLAIAFNDNAVRRVAGGGVTLPLFDNGLSLTLEGTIADTQPFVPGAFFQSHGLFKRLNARMSYPLIRSRAENLTLGGAFEYSVQTETAAGFGVKLDQDRLNVLRLNLGWNRIFDWGGSLDLSGQLSKGVSWLNARSITEVIASGAGFSRFGTTPNFSKAEARLAFIKGELPFGAAASLQLRGQLSFNYVMPSSELFSLDGEDAISSMTSGSLSGDSGVAARAELQRFTPWREFNFTPYVFFSSGRIYNQFRGIGDILSATGFGVGLRASREAVMGFTPTLALEAGHQNAGALSTSRLMVSLGVSY
jgi:hemolysin activation/secretion protein